MVAPRRLIALPTDEEQRQRLLEISRSRTEPTGRVERARIILAYLDDPSAYAVARSIGVTQQTVTRCLERAAELGVIEALDDRPRAGRDPVITAGLAHVRALDLCHSCSLGHCAMTLAVAASAAGSGFDAVAGGVAPDLANDGIWKVAGSHGALEYHG